MLRLTAASLLLTLALGCGGAEQQDTTEGPANAPAAGDTSGADTSDGEALDLSHLSAEDQAAALKQRICPVGSALGDDVLLGSGGMKTVKVNVQGRDVFLCCEGCESALREEPEKYFAILDGKPEPTEPSASTEDNTSATKEPAPPQQ